MNETLEEVIAAAKQARGYKVVEGAMLNVPVADKEVTADEARSILYSVLRWCMAYGSEQMSKEKAVELTERFFQCFKEEEKSYYTNGCFTSEDTDKNTPYKRMSLSSWNPFTHLTFNTGICVRTPQRSGYLWIGDQD